MAGHILDEDTVALWPLDEPINAHVTLASYSSAAGTSHQVIFDGVNDNIQMGDFLPFERTEAWSVSIWFATINTTWTDTNSHLISKALSDTSRRGWRVLMTVGNQIELRIENNDSAAPAFNRLVVHSNSTFVDGKRRCAVFTYDGSSTAAGIRLYVDGILQATTVIANGDTLTQTTLSNAILQIGGLNGGLSYNGILEHGSIWNKELTPSEVLEVFGTGSPPNLLTTSMVASLLGWWKVDGTDDLSIPDGVIDGAVDPHNGTGFGGITYYIPNLTRFTGDVNTPGIAGGPILANGDGQDNCRWFNNYSNSHRGMTAASHIAAIKCLLGPVWTIEGYVYLDRDPATVGSQQQLVEYGGNGETQAANYLVEVLVNTNRTVTVFWESGAGVDRSVTSTGTLPINQWIHFAIIGTENGVNRDIQFYFGAVDAGLVTGTVKADGGTTSAWFLGIDRTPTAQLFGGLAYIRISQVARTLTEIQNAAQDPSLIVDDVNTSVFWGFQEPPQNRDISKNGFHLMERQLAIGGSPSVLITDLYGVSGISRFLPSKQYLEPATNNSAEMMPRQLMANTMVDANEYTIETWFRADYNTDPHTLFFAGATNPVNDLIQDNTVVNWLLQSDNKFNMSYEGELGIDWSMTTSQVAFPVASNQSGQLGRWYHLATRKRTVGNKGHWFFSKAMDGIYIENQPSFAFERNQPFTLIIWINAQAISVVRHLMGKTEPAPNPAGYQLALDTSGRAIFRIENNAGQRAQRRVTTNSASLGTVRCIAVTYSGNSNISGINIYYDGVLQAMTTVTNNLASGSALNTFPFTFGTAALQTEPYTGYILNSSVWNKELNASEVLEAFGSTGRPPPDLLATSMAANLVGWWKFNNDDNVDENGLIDYSGLGNHGTTGLWVFNGDQDAINMGDNYRFERTDPFSIAAWVWMRGTSNILPRIFQRTGTLDGRGFFLTSASADDQVRFQLGGGGNDIIIRSNAVLPQDRLVHVVATYNGNSLATGQQLYFDGVLQTTTTLAGGPLNTTIAQSGQFTLSVTGTRAWSGLIRHASVWNKTLSPIEVGEIYGGGTPPDLNAVSCAANLVGWWKLDKDDSISLITDYSPSGNDGTVVNTIKYSPDLSMKPSSEWDIFVNGLPLETVGPFPDPKVGDIYTATTSGAVHQMHATTTAESRGNTRISSVARTDAEILESYLLGLGGNVSFTYKMRAVDSGRPEPGYIYWIADFPDFGATMVGTSIPPLIGTVVPGSVIELTSWND